MCKLILAALAAAVVARDITFPPVAAIQQYPLSEHDSNGPIDISSARYAGLTTYANLPYVHCLAGEAEQIQKYDIAILGAPFDTVSLSFVLSIDAHWSC